VRRLGALLPDARVWGATRIAAIGPGTVAALADLHLGVDLAPERAVAEELLAAFPDPDGPGTVLLARAAVARDVLPDGLAGRGWAVEVVEAYRTLPADPSEAAVADAAAADAICFTSSSTVTNYLAAAGREAVPPVVVCIGPVTAATARAAGLTVAAEAAAPTIPALVDALTAVLDRPPPAPPAPSA
jgi:uroporphyrinogen III methyltransferase/synthase